MTAATATPQLDLGAAPLSPRTGIRLDSIEMVNWGTFDNRIWRFNLGGTRPSVHSGAEERRRLVINPVGFDRAGPDRD
jgi:uncharacterized protein YPO0396